MIHRILIRAAAVLAAGAMAASVGAAAPADSLMYWRVEANASAGGGDRSPFWLTNNRMGLSSVNNGNGYLRAGFFREQQTDRRFSWGAGVDLAGAFHSTSCFVIQQLYGSVRYRALELTVGSKERRSQFVDPELSSGDLLMSENARPIPQARLAIEDYRYIPGTRDRLAVRGYFSFGMFTDGDWQYSFTRGHDTQRAKNVLYHSKGIFLRWGNTERFPLTVEGGLEMGAQWGGTVYMPDGTVIHPGSGFKDAMKVIIPSGSSSDNPALAPDKANVAGNHTGEWSLAAAWTPKNADWSARLYYQHYFEDHSMMFFNHFWRDMLLGIELGLPRNRFVDKAVYEYLITKDQSGPVYYDKTPEIPYQVSGRDNYYNNFLYGGWQHWGMGLGNPLVLSPVYNADHHIYFYNNRIKAHHFGLSGSPLAGLRWRLLISYTRSWGTYAEPSPEILRACSGLLEVSYAPRRLAGWGARLSLAADHGSLIGDNYGAMISIVKKGWL